MFGKVWDERVSGRITFFGSPRTGSAEMASKDQLQR